MASSNEWNAPVILRSFAVSELALARLRWLYVKSGLGFEAAPAAVSRSLDGLLSEPLLRPAAI